MGLAMGRLRRLAVGSLLFLLASLAPTACSNSTGTQTDLPATSDRGGTDHPAADTGASDTAGDTARSDGAAGDMSSMADRATVDGPTGNDAPVSDRPAGGDAPADRQPMADGLGFDLPFDIPAGLDIPGGFDFGAFDLPSSGATCQDLQNCCALVDPMFAMFCEQLAQSGNDMLCGLIFDQFRMNGSC